MPGPPDAPVTGVQRRRRWRAPGQYLPGAVCQWRRGMVEALIITYRLWQLRSRRVSLAEGGTFRHFLTETRAVGNAIRGR
ncbi:hypothetical protein [Leclercia adecarboxylata]|uniref:hypothetical protein n=1 Tax=Leclercia adecarboxylata TaxID=83655 RepID=UPI00294A7610|nr:hypothetical protein [Leclercia adecarboxylata]MDV5280063.1 hypothetical protein [Leclercia adecarboxylata]